MAGGPAQRAGLQPRVRGAGLRAAGRRAAGDRARARDDHLDAPADRHGHAYAADGDVYFDVRSFPAYGALSGQKLDHMLPADDTEPNDAKRDPRDFALWKGAKPGEPAWDTPWGPGPARLAPGVLGDGHQVPRAHLRHPRRRPRPDLPAPRERDRPVQGGRRRVRAVLDAQRAGRGGRREDVQVAGQLAAGGRDGEPGAADRAALLPRAAALPLHDRVLARGAGGGGRRLRPDRELRDPGRRGQRDGRRAPTCPPSSPPPWTTTSACRRPLPCCTTRSATATRRWPRATRKRPPPRSARCGPCSACSASIRWTSSGRRRGAGADLHAVVGALVAVALAQRQAARERKDYAATDAIRDHLTRRAW